VQEKSAETGILVERIGFRYIGFPEAVTNTVLQRMAEDRKRLAMDYISQGETEVRKISFEASREFDLIKTEAEVKANEIRQKTEAAIYESYREFQKNPELAEFLSKAETLKKMGGPGTTVFLDTSMPPFNLMKADAIQFKSTPAVLPAIPAIRVPAAPVSTATPAAPATPAKP
jgi:regulator of protease activity HflC (stomatin/prohibitin superfamily)